MNKITALNQKVANFEHKIALEQKQEKSMKQTLVEEESKIKNDEAQSA